MRLEKGVEMRKGLIAITILGTLMFLQGCSFTETATNVMTRIDNAIKMNKERRKNISKAKIENMEKLMENGFLITDVRGTYRSPLNNKKYEVKTMETYIKGTEITDANSYNEMPYVSSCNGNECNVRLNIFYKVSKGVYQDTSIAFTLVRNGNYWYILYSDPANQDVSTYNIGYLNRGDSRYVHLHNSTYDISFNIERIK